MVSGLAFHLIKSAQAERKTPISCSHDTRIDDDGKVVPLQGSPVQDRGNGRGLRSREKKGVFSYDYQGKYLLVDISIF